MNSVYINGITTSAPNVIRKLFSDSKLRFVLANVALTINDRINKLTSPGVSTSTDRRNIKQIITDALRAAGYSKNESKDLFYTIIALYGTRGANLDSIYEFLDKDNYIINLAMQFITVGISILEFESSDPTERFHLPQNIKSSCNFMNPYHFWMSAYLSRELVKKGYSKRTAFNAVHITSVGYQLMANNWGRDPRLFLDVKHDHRYMDYLRSTVIYDDAGALYGSGFLNNIKWDLDPRTKILFDQYVPLQIKKKNKGKVFENLALRYSVWSLLTPHNRAFPLITGGIQIQSEVRGETLFETDDFKNYDFTADDYDLNQNYDLIK